ncbi:hypothetical protein ACFC18_54415, partial [Streptomyces sp. NPDC056121]|uniref:hypothetical protein n=1 Tax=Streptomyces sp. NPDC056121 TaxID=3345718 RepID=UPI0035E383AC
MSELRQYTLARLRETETGLPLSDVVVQVLNLDGQGPVEIDRQVTDDDGLVPVAYPAETGRASQGRLRLIARTRADVEFWSRDVDVPPADGAMLTFDVSAPPDGAEPETHDLTEVIEATDVQVSHDLASYLRDKGIRSLADIRRLGGLAHDDDLPVPSDDPSVVALDAHADLGAVSSDIASNQALIKAGYGSVAEIAAAPLPDFFAAAHDILGDFGAARLHTVAGARTSVLKSVLASLALGKANGLASENSPTIHETSSSAPDPLLSTCGCEDCEAAVSPAAYLADLLA